MKNKKKRKKNVKQKENLKVCQSIQTAAIIYLSYIQIQYTYIFVTYVYIHIEYVIHKESARETDTHSMQKIQFPL